MMNTILILALLNAGVSGPASSDADPGYQGPEDPLRIIIIYDNYAYARGIQTDWGFSALLEYNGEQVLFDTGTNGEILLANADHLGLDLSRIEHLFLSHEHGDHTGGIASFFGQLDGNIRPQCYILHSFPIALKESVAERCEVIESSPWEQIMEGVYSTGEVSGPVNEQAIVVTTDYGIFVLTGCAHPGIVKIVESAKEHFSSDVLHVIGGFHLGGQPASSLKQVVSEFRRLGVQKVTVTHCTGDEAIALFRAEYGDAFIPGGAGAVIVPDFRR